MKMLNKKEMIESLFESGTISKKEYESMLQRIESKVMTDNSITSLLDSFEKYLKANFSKHTASGYVSNTKGYFEFIHNDDIDNVADRTDSEISVELAQKWLNSLATEGYSSVSIRRYKNSFSKFIEFLTEQKSIDVPDVSSLTIADTSDSVELVDALTDIEIRELAKNANNLRDKLIILMIYELGLRRQEAIDLKKSDINNDTSVVTIRKENEVDRVGELSKSTHNMLIQYLDDFETLVQETNEKRLNKGNKNIVADSEYVFQTLRSDKISYAVIFKAITDASENTYGSAKDIEVTTETLRRSRRVYYFSLGYDTQRVQALMGDANYHVCKKSLRLAQIMYPEKFR